MPPSAIFFAKKIHCIWSGSYSVVIRVYFMLFSHVLKYFYFNNFNKKKHCICESLEYPMSSCLAGRNAKRHLMEVSSENGSPTGIAKQGAEKLIPSALLKANHKIVSEYDQEIPQSQTADNPMARKSHPTTTRHQEDKLSKATSSLFPTKMIAILE